MSQDPVTALFLAVDHAGFSALSDPTRREVLRALLVGGPSDLGTLSLGLPVDRSVVSRHVAALVDAGLVRIERDGRRRIASVQGAEWLSRLEALLAAARGCCATCCPQEL